MRRWWVRGSLAVVGVLIVALGLLWLSQGVGLLRLDPIACVGPCEPVTGPSPVWAVTGLVTSLAGGALIALARHR